MLIEMAFNYFAGIEDGLGNFCMLGVCSLRILIYILTKSDPDREVESEDNKK